MDNYFNDNRNRKIFSILLGLVKKVAIYNAIISDEKDNNAINISCLCDIPFHFGQFNRGNCDDESEKTYHPKSLYSTFLIF